MAELATKAENYAAEKTNDVMTKAIAQAYADGYRDGYKDREEKIPVDLRDNKTEYVDLGLPSGTLWSADYEKEGDANLFIPLNDALKNSIPTREQCLELYKYCRFKVDGIIFCIGPNGKSITFSPTGYKEIDNEEMKPTVISFFWIKNDEENQPHNAAAIGFNPGVWYDTREMFSGYKLPIRLVKTK